jgi:hypothetical protein
MGRNFAGCSKISIFVQKDRQMILNSQITSFVLEDVVLRLKTDAEGFVKDFSAFSQQELTLTDANIGIDRKSLYAWKKQGLLPYSGLPKKGGKGKNWGRFSFIELCWIRVLMEYRAVGISIERLQELTAALYPKGFIQQLYSKPIDNLSESLDSRTLELAKQKNLFQGDQLVITDNVIELFEELQFSLFSCLLYATMLSKKHYMLYIDSSGKIDLIDLDILIKDPLLGVMDFHKLLSNKSALFVNIRKIIADLSGTHEHFSKELNFGQIMSDSSVDFLKGLFKDGQVREVILRVNETGRPLAIIKRKMSMADLEKQVREVRKKGNYFDILIKTRDGDVKYFEHTEIIKL